MGRRMPLLPLVARLIGWLVAKGFRTLRELFGV